QRIELADGVGVEPIVLAPDVDDLVLPLRHGPLAPSRRRYDSTSAGLPAKRAPAIRGPARRDRARPEGARTRNDAMRHALLERHLLRHVAFSPAELAACCDRFHPHRVAKKEFLLREGDVSRWEGFVVRGCFRLFSTDHDGNENVLYFAAEDWWVTDIDSFHHETPAHLSIQALEDSELLVIGKADKDAL